MKKDFAKKITDRIKKENIVPKSKWQCHWENYALWAAWAVVIVSGALLFSLSLLRFIGFNFGLFPLLKLRGIVGLLFQMTPFLVVGLTIIIMALGYYMLKGTKRGYRYSAPFVLAIIFLIVLLLGSFFHLTRLNNRIENGLSQRIGPYQRIINSDKKRLDRPEGGTLAGEIRQISKNKLELESFHNKTWEVDYKAEDVRGPIKNLEIGQEILIIGEMQEEGLFDAQMIKSLRPFEKDREKMQEKMEKGAKARQFKNQRKPFAPHPY